MAIRKKDTRDKLWAKMEREIQKRAPSKDRNFRLTGKWKKFVRKQDGYKIFSVDGTWIRSNLCIYYGHGGHGLVFEFIPMDEIWVETNHYHEGSSSFLICRCKVRNPTQKVSKNYFDSTVIHEIHEANLMKKGMSYFRAHQLALQKEREVGLLRDPFDDR
jgi:hypothetical protein